MLTKKENEINPRDKNEQGRAGNAERVSDVWHANSSFLRGKYQSLLSFCGEQLRTIKHCVGNLDIFVSICLAVSWVHEERSQTQTISTLQVKGSSGFMSESSQVKNQAENLTTKTSSTKMKERISENGGSLENVTVSYGEEGR